MECFWLKDQIRDKNSLLLIAQCNFWLKRKKKSRVFRICTTAAGERLELRGCTHYSLDIRLCSAVRQALDSVCFYLWTCLHDKKKQTSGSFRDDKFLQWRHSVKTNSRLVNPLFIFLQQRACRHHHFGIQGNDALKWPRVPQLLWGRTKEAPDPIDSHDTKKTAH